MIQQCDEILKQYGISGCTEFSFPLKSEPPISLKPPTHPNPNVVRICKSVRNIGHSLTRYVTLYNNHSAPWELHFISNTSMSALILTEVYLR